MTIIDGRNRYRACQQAGIQPHFRTWDGRGSMVAFVISLNLHRRHLNESQRAVVAAKAKPMFEEEAKERQGARTDLRANLPGSSARCPYCHCSYTSPPGHICKQMGRARDKAAELLNISPRSVESASRVLNSGVEELVHAVESGNVAVSTAAKIATLPEEEQQEVVARGEGSDGNDGFFCEVRPSRQNLATSLFAGVFCQRINRFSKLTVTLDGRTGYFVLKREALGCRRLLLILRRS